MKSWPSLAGPLLVVALAFFMIIDPGSTLEAASTGLRLWFNAVLPALFPFFVICDLMLGLGVVHFMGVILDPVMRPLFRLPGAAGFVVAMGLTSGFPVGAVLTRRLYEDGALTGREAEHLVSFTNNASPLFIIGVVGAGLFHSPAAGYLLASAHYLSNILVGILLGRYASPRHSRRKRGGNLFSLALTELAAAHRSHQGPGQLLGDAIKKAILNVTTVGGFIVVFSVLTAALSKWGVTTLLADLFQLLGVSYPSSLGLGVGIFEMTLGAKALAASAGAELEKLLAVSGVLAWSGLSIQAQVMSIVSGAPVRYGYYVKARLLQAFLSLGFTFLGFGWWFGNTPAVQLPPAAGAMPLALDFFKAGCQGLLGGMAVLLLLGLLSWARSVRFSRTAH